MKYIPNILTFLRITIAFLLIPVTFIYKDISILFCMFIVASLSDFFDGYIARKFCAVSKLGSIIDPLADKILIIISYTLLAYIGFINYNVIFVVILRDILIMGTVLYCFVCNIYVKMQPLMSSKINTTIQLMYICFVLFCKSFNLDAKYMYLNTVSHIFGIVVIVFTIISGIHYLYTYRWIKNEFDKR